MTAPHAPRPYIPALSHDRLTPFYDQVMGLFMHEMQFKRRLIEQAALRAGQRVLDVGCGTGTLTILLKHLHPEVAVFGIDIDPHILALARAKVAQAQVLVTLEESSATALPFLNASFDAVFSSLMIHHLPTHDKRRLFAEAKRVLKPTGGLHIADFGTPRHPYARLLHPVMRRLEQAADNFDGKLPDLMRAADLNVRETEHFLTLFGTLTLWHAQPA